jgi:hypothetical protein
LPLLPSVSKIDVYLDEKLKFKQVIQDADAPEYAQRLLSLATQRAGVTQVRINPAAKSIAVEFDPQLPVEQIALAQNTLFEMFYLLSTPC